MAVSGGVPCRQFVSIVVQCMFVVSVGRLMLTVCVSIVVLCMSIVAQCMFADSLCLLLYSACLFYLLPD